MDVLREKLILEENLLKKTASGMQTGGRSWAYVTNLQMRVLWSLGPLNVRQYVTSTTV